MLTRVFATSLAVVTALAFSTAAAEAGFARPATVFITHGIPGPADSPIDVLVTGPFGIRGCLAGLTFSKVAGPFFVPSGDYTLAVAKHTPAEPCSGTPVIGPRPLPLEPGEDTAITFYLTADGQPTSGKFDVNLRPGAPGRSRVNVFHLAAAPDVDIRISRGPADPCAPFLTIPEVSNGDSGSISLPPGDYNVSVTPAGSSTPMIGPAAISLRPAVAYLFFAVGSRSDGTLTLARAQTVVQPR